MDLVLELEHLNQALPSDPAAAMTTLCARFPNKVIFTTSLGVEDQVVTHLIATNNLNIEIATIDTGRLFEETHQTLSTTMKRYRLPIRVVSPDPSALERLYGAQGVNGFYDSLENRLACCDTRKRAPLSQILSGMRVWITGLRAGQSENRHSFKRLMIDESFGVLKFNPLIDWTADEVANFLSNNQVPVNPLAYKGYPSIGCAPCTRPVQEGEDPRSGRWWWETSHKECGLHLATKRNP